jgi:hypothetical protein
MIVGLAIREKIPPPPRPPPAVFPVTRQFVIVGRTR